MASLNKVLLIGRLGKDPEIRMTPSGQNVCTMTLATSEVIVKDGAKEEKTEWHRVVLWARLADLASKFLKKGRQVYIEGRLQTRSWDDKDGQKRYTTEIVASQLLFMDGNRSADVDAPLEDDPFATPVAGTPSAPSAPLRSASAPRPVVSKTQVSDDIPF